VVTDAENVEVPSGVRLLGAGFSGPRLYRAVVRILEANELCSMASVSDGGPVHINTAFFCFGDELDLYFLSEPASVHGRNISRSPQLAIAVFDSRQRWGAAHKGLQLFGSCALATGAAEERARELYSLRFLYREFLESLSREKREAYSLRFYGFTAATVKILDEDEFGEAVFVTAKIAR